jgi:hypothetical protein
VRTSSCRGAGAPSSRRHGAPTASARWGSWCTTPSTRGTNPPRRPTAAWGGMRRRRGPRRRAITSAATAPRQASLGSGPRSIRRRSTSTPPCTGTAGLTAPTTGCSRGLARGATSARSNRQRQQGAGGDVRITLPQWEVPPHRSQRHVGPGMARGVLRVGPAPGHGGRLRRRRLLLQRWRRRPPRG